MILKARHRCPVSIIVVAPSTTVARWARKAITMDGHGSFTPIVLGPEQIGRPSSPDEPPERLLLAARAHPDIDAALVALEGADRLPAETRTEYIETLISLLPEAIEKELRQMATTTRARLYPASNFAKEHYGKGQRELLLELLTDAFGAVPEPLQDRLRSAEIEQLRTWARRVRTAQTLEQVFADD